MFRAWVSAPAGGESPRPVSTRTVSCPTRWQPVTRISASASTHRIVFIAAPVRGSRGPPRPDVPPPPRHAPARAGRAPPRPAGIRAPAAAPARPPSTYVRPTPRATTRCSAGPHRSAASSLSGYDRTAGSPDSAPANRAMCSPVSGSSGRAPSGSDRSVRAGRGLRYESASDSPSPGRWMSLRTDAASLRATSARLSPRRARGSGPSGSNDRRALRSRRIPRARRASTSRSCLTGRGATSPGIRVCPYPNSIATQSRRIRTW